MYGKEELKSYKLGASRSGFFFRLRLSISEMNTVAEQPNLEMLGGFNLQWRGLATASLQGQHWLLG